MPSKKLSHRFGRPSPALALAAIALFVALGGTSYAVATNSISSAEIRNNDVRSKDVRNNNIRSGDVRNRSLLARDFKAGQLPAGPRGLRGAQGPRGLQGLQGPAGTPGISNIERVTGSSPSNSQSGKDTSADCPGNKKVVGSGAELVGESSGAFPNQVQNVAVSDIVVAPNLEFVFVRAQEVNAIATNWTVKAYALCANVQ